MKNKNNRVLFRSRITKFFVPIIFCAFFILSRTPALAAVITWDNGGGDGLWSTCTNWSTNSCPGAGDIATFDATSTAAASIDDGAGFGGSVGGIDINAGYSGTITNNRTTGLTIGSSNFAQDTGTFNGGSTAIDINGTFTLAGGIFTATSGNFNVSGNWTHTAGGTFTHNNGTVILDDGAATLDFNASETYYAVQLNKTGGNGIIISSGDTMITTGLLLLTDGFIDTGALDAQGSVTVASGFDGGSYTGLTFSGGNTQTFTLTGAEGLIDVDITVNKSGGSVNLASTLTLDAASQDLLVVEGVFNANGQTLTVNGGGGSFIVQDGGTFAWNGDEALTMPGGGPTIQSGSTIIYNDTSGTRNIRDWAYHHLTISGAGGTFTLGANESIAGNFTATAGTFDANNYTMAVAGNTIINGGTVLTDRNTFAFGDGAGDAVTISSGELRIESDNVGADIQKNAGTWTNSGGTITYAGSTVFAAILTELSPYYNLAFDASGSAYDLGPGDITVNGSVTITTGTFDATAGTPRTITVAGGWTDTGAGAFTEADSTVAFTGTGTINANEAFNKITINSAGTVTLGAALDVNGLLTLTAGTLAVGGSNYGINVAGGWTDAGAGTFTEGTGTVTFDGTGTINANEAFNNVTINEGTGGTLTLGAPLDVNGNVTLSNGTLDVSGSNHQINVAGNWAKSGGSFNAQTGTVVFDDVSKTSVLSGNTSFRNLTCATSDKTILFTNGSTQTVNGTLTFTGTASHLITLNSTANDNQWGLIAAGSNNVSYVNVRDSNASGGNLIMQTNSTNSGNNTNWNFNIAPVAPTTLYSNNTSTTAQAGDANPENLSDSTPNFSAIYNDTDAGDIANKYCIEVDTAVGFNGTDMWLSDGAACATGSTITNITAGSRSTDIVYAGSALTCGTTYYWQMKFWDDSGDAGSWSSAANFEVNCTPTTGAASGSTNEDAQLAGDLSHTDADDAVTYSIVTNGSKGTATITDAATGAFSYVPSANQNGTDTFTYKVNDGMVDSNTSTYTVTINALNDTPTAAAGVDITITEDNASTNLSGSGSTDVDTSDTLTYAWIETTDSADACSLTNATSASPTVTVGNEASNYNCVYSLTVNDGTVSSTADTVTVYVTANNDSPTITSSTATTISAVAGDTIIIVASFADVDSTPTMSAVDVGGNLSNANDYLAVTGTTGSWSWTAVAGDYQIKFNATDGTNTASTSTFSISVATGNTAPVFTIALPNAGIWAGQTVTIFDLDDYVTDQDSDAISYTATVDNSDISITITNGAVVVTADESYSGYDDILFSASDSTATVSDSMVLTVSELASSDIGLVIGTNQGNGTIITKDQAGNVIASWQAYAEGGAIPKLTNINGVTYVFVVKKRSGSTMHVYTALGQLIDKKRLSPKLHWRTLATGELDNKSNSEEVVVGAKRGSSIYLKVYSFNANTNHFKLLKRYLFRPITQAYRLKIQDKKVIFILNKKGKIVDQWEPFAND